MRTVPIKIRKATSNLRKKHVGADFTFANKTFLKDIATLLGPESVFVLSIDDKAKCTIRNNSGNSPSTACNALGV